MPAPGDQHKAWANPFEDVKPRISEWTAKDIATISSRLDKQLGPEYISSRAGPGGSRVHYLTAEKCIGLANEVFGFNGWSSSIQNIQVDFADENPQTQRVSIGLSVIVRITLRDGTYHEDVGYGSIENAKSKAMGFEKAKKEGTTDAMKRTLRNFGNVLGNCIYDQDYVKQVTKLKAHPVKKFDQDNLHRHSDFMRKDLTKIEPIGNTNANRNTVGNGSGNTSITAPSGGVKPEPIDSFEDFLGELDEADFCVPEDGHPDEIILPTINNTSNTNDRLAINAPSHMQQPAGQAARPIPANQTKQTPHTPRQGPIRPNVQHDSQAAPPGRPQPAAHPRDASNNATATFQPPPAQQGGNPSEPVAFFSARSVASASDQPGQGNNQSGPKQLFNPKAESPSIRKTPGIDHTSSKPLSRSGQHVAPPSSQSSGAQPATTSNSTPLRQSVSSSQLSRGNVLNPSLDHARRIGVPGGPGSPLSNRNSYRPPTMKRPLGGEATGPNGSRTPLADIQSNANGNAASGSTNGPLDAKRQKTT